MNTTSKPTPPAESPEADGSLVHQDSIPQFYRAENYSAEHSVGYLIRRILSRLQVDIDRRMEPHGLTSAQWVPLLKLYLGQATTAAELARDCELDAGAMTRLLDRIEAKGLCRRERSAQDRRVVNLSMTTEGEAVAALIPQVLSEAQNRMLTGFSEAEWQQLKGLLRRMLDNANTVVPTDDSSSPPS